MEICQYAKQKYSLAKALFALEQTLEIGNGEKIEIFVITNFSFLQHCSPPNPHNFSCNQKSQLKELLLTKDFVAWQKNCKPPNLLEDIFKVWRRLKKLLAGGKIVRTRNGLLLTDSK